MLFMLTIHSLNVGLHCVVRNIFLSLGNFAQIRSPGGQAECYYDVKEDNVGHEPPIERRGLRAAKIVQATTPKYLHLHEEHHPTHKEVKGK